MKKEKKKEKKQEKKKKIIKIVIITLIVGLGLFIFISILPFLIFAGSVIWQMLDKPDKPINEHGEFPFELVYEYKGELNTIKDTIICDYDGYSYAIETGNTNDWNCYFENNNEYGNYYVDKENEPDLYISVPDGASYFMGEKNESKDDIKPYIYYVDNNTGTHYYENEKVDVVDLKIIKWNPSEPLKNNFK